MIGRPRTAALPGRRPSRSARRRPRRFGGRSVPGLRRPGPRLVAALVGGLVLLAGLYVWLRDSSLVAVQTVRISGASGADAAQIRASLRSAARAMTTLDVKMGALETAVAPFPVVKSLNVTTSFPHAMSIHVVEQVPVAIVQAGGRRTPVAGDGTLLHDVRFTPTLPVISLGVVPGGSRLTGWALSETRLLAAAPFQLLARISSVSDGSAHGLAAQLRSGPAVYFGSADQLAPKWSAVVEALASSTSTNAVYLDVTDPNRPAAGGSTDTSTTSTAATASTPSGSG